MSTGTLSRKCERSKSLCLQAKKKKKKKRCQLSSAHLWITAQPRVLPWCCASPSASHLPGKALRESVEGAGFCLPERLRRIKPSEEQTAAPPCSASAPRGRRLLSEEVFLADVATAAPAPGGSLFAPESQLPKTLPKHVWRSRSRRLGGSQRGFLGRWSRSRVAPDVLEVRQETEITLGLIALPKEWHSSLGERRKPGTHRSLSLPSSGLESSPRPTPKPGALSA